MLSIRTATIEDLDIVAELFNQYRIFYKQEPDIVSATAFLMARINNNESKIFIAFKGDEPVGFTQLYPLFSSVGMRRTWLLNDLYVIANARKTGAGTALLAMAKDFAKSTGARSLMLETSADNYTAQSVYEKNGWKKSDGFFYQFYL